MADESGTPLKDCKSLPQNDVSALWERTDCYHKNGNHQQAIRSLKEIIRRDPKDLDAYFVARWMLWNESKLHLAPKNKQLLRDAKKIMKLAKEQNERHWMVEYEWGDYYFLRLNEPTKAIVHYLKARELYNGDKADGVQEASKGKKAAIENRIARTAELLNRPGDAVLASCRALYFDPDDKSAKTRLKELGGNCLRKPDISKEESSKKKD